MTFTVVAHATELAFIRMEASDMYETRHLVHRRSIG